MDGQHPLPDGRVRIPFSFSPECRARIFHRLNKRRLTTIEWDVPTSQIVTISLSVAGGIIWKFKRSQLEFYGNKQSVEFELCGDLLDDDRIVLYCKIGTDLPVSHIAKFNITLTFKEPPKKGENKENSEKTYEYWIHRPFYRTSEVRWGSHLETSPSVDKAHILRVGTPKGKVTKLKVMIDQLIFYAYRVSTTTNFDWWMFALPFVADGSNRFFFVDIGKDEKEWADETERNVCVYWVSYQKKLRYVEGKLVLV
jgi:hypothetical protein